ncbi:MAG: thiol reductant ABC exporter subunit CydD [Streptococcaceae bacterium]|jgi:ATP-binding cassette subfamily C protein CydD|nr:thiol reductant ABC exporter subunit CydD [Streptococcaceae bacterium]
MIDKSLIALPGVRRVFPILGLLAVFQALCISGQALFLSAVLTGLWEHKTFTEVLPQAAGFAVCFLTREGVNFLRQKLLDGFSYKLASEMRENLLTKMFQLGPVALQELGTGTAASTVITGIDEVEMYIKLVLSKVLNMMVIPVLLLIVIAFLDWRSAIVLLIAFPFAIIFMILLGYAAQSRAERQYKSFQLLSNHFLDSLRGISTLKYFGKSKDYANSIYLTSERFRKATMNTLRVAMLSTFALDFFATLSVATVALFLGLRLMDGHILLSPALAALILAPEYFLPLREFANDYHATLNGKNALASVNQLLAMDEHSSSELTEVIHWSKNSTLNLSELTKTYESGRGVSDVNFELSGFKKIALVGASGAGKTTLLSMLSGFLSPDSGQITLNEQKLSGLTDENWRRSLSFIPQSTYIFSGSLRENVAFYEKSATDAEILEAMRLAGLADLNLSLDERIGAGGRVLSGGQKQRVALARAFLAKDRSILCLDEPTAHLDIETELEIKENILPLFEDKLVILATHRLHWLPQMDQIILLNEGQVVGIGPHEELYRENNYYKQLLEEMS